MGRLSFFTVIFQRGAIFVTSCLVPFRETFQKCSTLRGQKLLLQLIPIKKGGNKICPHTGLLARQWLAHHMKNFNQSSNVEDNTDADTSSNSRMAMIALDKREH